MSKGVLLIALNNDQIDYIKQALFCAKHVKKYLNLPVALATDNVEYLKKTYSFYSTYIDDLIEIEPYQTKQKKSYRDGMYSRKVLPWKNQYRIKSFDISPYNETIVMDTDYIVNNKTLLNCFKSHEDFLIYKSYKDINPVRKESSFERISDRSIDMVWATVFYFKKTETTKFFFDLIKHIHDNWHFYRLIHQIPSVNFRNDYAFSIAIHMLNGFQKSDWPKSLPGKFWTTTDTDILLEFNNDEFKFLLDNTDDRGQFYAGKVQGLNIHIMNKFSLNRIVDKVFDNE